MNGDKVRLKVRLYKLYRRRKQKRTTTARILGFRDGGSSELGNFVKSYKTETARFTGPGQENPVIIVYDNDSGTQGLQNSFKTYGKNPKTNNPFVDLVRNLYAVPTPLLNGATQSTIEDFLECEYQGNDNWRQNFQP